MSSIIRVIIPAYNEEKSIGQVIQEIPKEAVTEIIVINNNSTDNTSLVASQQGVTVIHEPTPGYGKACLKGMSYIAEFYPETEIIVFLDGDHSDYPEEIYDLLHPILQDDVDLVIGSRALGQRERGSMTPQQIFGNWLATRLLKLIYNVKFTDLGPFRSIKYEKLLQLDMQDQTYGWTVEMQLKAAKQKFSIQEVPVRYRKRIGISKISGTIKGTIMAGYKIIYTILKYA